MSLPVLRRHSFVRTTLISISLNEVCTRTISAEQSEDYGDGLVTPSASGLSMSIVTIGYIGNVFTVVQCPANDSVSDLG